MTPAGEILRDEIRRHGPISFHRFMDTALYHPEYGYYRRKRDPFGKYGDYYTAEQLQPVFGILIAAHIRALFEGMGRPAEFTIVEVGAGRGEMQPAFAEWRYVPVEAGGKLPEQIRGVVFSNEFFDALPVHVVRMMAGALRELRVGLRGDGFAWVTGDRAGPELERYIHSYFPSPAEGQILEVNLEALRWVERIAGALAAGYALTIDYGYTTAEAVRFPRGTLMSYRRHLATEEVLQDPGERDVTAHVCFTALERHGSECGLYAVALEPLVQTLLRSGEADQFRFALAAPTAQEEMRRRLQLKTLLFGMGETFRSLLQRKDAK